MCHAFEITSLAAKLLVAVRSLCPHRAPLFDNVVATAVDGDVVEPFMYCAEKISVRLAFLAHLCYSHDYLGMV